MHPKISSTLKKKVVKEESFMFNEEKNQTLNFKLNTSLIIFILLTVAFITNARSFGKTLIRAGI